MRHSTNLVGGVVSAIVFQTSQCGKFPKRRQKTVRLWRKKKIVIWISYVEDIRFSVKLSVKTFFFSNTCVCFMSRANSNILVYQLLSTFCKGNPKENVEFINFF